MAFIVRCYLLEDGVVSLGPRTAATWFRELAFVERARTARSACWFASTLLGWRRAPRRGAGGCRQTRGRAWHTSCSC